MNELRITRCMDIRLFSGSRELYGVTSFRAVTKREGRDIYEYLSSQPFDTASVNETHELELSVLSLFDSDAFETDGFSISVLDGDAEFVYEDCAVIKREQRLEGEKNSVEHYTVRAKRMTKRGREHD